MSDRDPDPPTAAEPSTDELSTDEPSTDEPRPLERGDFYWNDEGLMVFTRAYHLKRGSCCKSGCLHCPWNYRPRSSRGRQREG